MPGQWVNFDDENEAYSDEEQKQLMDEIIENPEPQEHQVVLSEAVKRIQQAKLYETLLSHSLFAPGSADPEIQDRVEDELKTFILERLEVLLGMKSEATASRSQSLPFDEEQIQALALVANRALRRNVMSQPTPTPTINQVDQSQPEVQVQPVLAHSPKINQVRTQISTSQPSPRRTTRATPPQRTQVPTQQPVRPPKGTRKGSQNVGENTQKDLSQAVSVRVKPKRMPPQSVIDQINAVEAHKNTSGRNAASVDPQNPEASGNANVNAQLANLLVKSGSLG